MEICVCGREEIERGLLVRTDYVVISIRDPGRPRAKVKPQCGLRDTLFLAFHDVAPSANFELPPEARPITPTQADQICAFVRKHEAAVGAVVVHCEQGMSRSPAVAAAISDALGLDARQFWQLHTPNAYVYQTVADAFERSAAT